MNLCISILLKTLLSLLLPVRSRRPAVPSPGPRVHPESMTAVLARTDEEYLAWLADHHWPDDDYLELEHAWRAEIASAGVPDGVIHQVCPSCRRPGDDVWPCPNCGLLVHSTCGHGMRRRKIEKPYRTRDMRAESVIAEWICNHCTSVVGLDVDRGDEETGHGLHP